ncbi:MAG: IS3 family transposase [Verrucomicrobia bacterium]|nr:IS3 family transposase [Verrucomicrobiota bacterium]
METAKAIGRPISLSGMLKKLGVSRSGYRAFVRHKPSVTQLRKEAVKKKILDIHAGSHRNYGAPKIAKELQKSGERISERTVGLYMRELGIRAQWTKPWTTTTRDSDFSKDLHNILDEQFNPSRPNAVWCTDITYIWTLEGFAYLTSVMDLYSRKIIAWTLSDTMETYHVVDAINKAKARRKTDLPLILHSDRGSQYVSKAYREATERFQLSYSHKGYPYDNACIESFHSLIKREWLNRFRITSRTQAHKLVFEYIEAFYNTVRIHSHCDYMSPDQFEKLYQKVNAA